MDTDRNLLFGIIALQADLIDMSQFVEACTIWAARKDLPLCDLLLERGWILSSDKSHLDHLLERKLQKHGGDSRAGMSNVPDHVKRSLAALNDSDIQHTLESIPAPANALAEKTVDYIPESPDRYHLINLHARGGIGQVWLAHDHALGRNVALKELRRERTGSPIVQARFLNEARITGQLEHPGIVPVYELAQWPDDQRAFYTMRMLEGRTLTEAATAYHELRQRGEADSYELLSLLNAFVTVCQTMAYAHSRNVVHRDLKGHNVIMGSYGEVVVLDWGLAKVIGEDNETISQSDDDIERPEFRSGSELTVHGQLIGTPAYMAPEQAIADSHLIGRHTDIYGLGAILYEILTSHPPFTGTDANDVLRKVREESPLPPSQFVSDVPATLEAICLQALEKNPDKRQATAAELAEQIQRWLAKSAQQRQEEKERERFFRLSLDLLCISDFDGHFKQLNPAWERTLGWTIEELLATPWIEFVHPEDRDATLEALKILAGGESLRSHENRYLCKDGSWIWLEWNAVEIVGQELAYAVARNITDRKRTEESLKDATKEIAHLRNELQILKHSP